MSAPTVASTLSAILQRCQSSLVDSALVHQIDAAMLRELEDEEEELMRRDAAMPENETDENLDDEFMEEEDFVAATASASAEKGREQNQHQHQHQQDVNNNSLAFERGLQRMRELNKRSSSSQSNNSGRDR